MSHSIVFLTGLSLLLTHEMDAIRCKEWRIFPGLSKLNDKSGRLIFILAHVPILSWLFWQLTGSSNTAMLRTGIDVFLLIHFGLHLLFLKNKRNEFKDWISWTIITGAGICGGADLIFS